MRRFLWVWLVVWVLAAGGCRQAEPAELPAVASAPPTPTPEVGVSFVTLAPPTAVLIQTTPTPLPTATPTPTATPIVYLVEEGDTLLALAWARGNTVDDILALNPGVVPELLQIGQQLVLPPPATPLAQQAVGTLAPLAVTVTQVQAYRTPVGSLWLVGEVMNAGALPAENLQVEIGLRDAAGTAVGAATAWVAPPVLPPGAAAPFGVLVNEPPADLAAPVVSVVAGQTVADLGSRYLNLAAEGGVTAGADGQLQVQGEVVNEGGETAVGVLLVAALYDAAGQISGYAQQRLAAPLAPDERVSFAFDVAPPGGEATAVRLLAQGTRG
ncbi:MAG: FxLYD domain-containing protein [Anaerolineales bacterium]|nr:FxLYD domain-containing protein [Anaerolineales bacterium]